MGSKIVIVRSGDNIISGLVDDGELVEVSVDKARDNILLGNIYLGKVMNIVKNINAAFVELEDKQMCYLSLSDVRRPVFARSAHPGKLCAGDELIVQVVKESARYKAPLATTEFNLTGKYLVLVHAGRTLGISQKIKDHARREELRGILEPFLSGEYGFIVRTNAEDAPAELLEREARRLVTEYRQVVEYGVHWSTFSCLYSNLPAYVWSIRDSYSGEIEEIVTDDLEIFRTVQEYLDFYQPEDSRKLILYVNSMLSLSKLYAIEEKLNRALHERVWLDSGAYLIIQPTEALTVIDVNTGKAIKGKSDQENTFLNVNLEAAAEIARQLRLRNISGIIIVDFIDLKNDEHRRQLMKEFSAILAKDRIPSKLVDMTALNLVEITRKKIRKPVAEQLRGDSEE